MVRKGGIWEWVAWVGVLPAILMRCATERSRETEMGIWTGELVNTSARVMIPSWAWASKAGLCTTACCKFTRPEPAVPCRMIELIGDFFRSAVKPPLLLVLALLLPTPVKLESNDVAVAAGFFARSGMTPMVLISVLRKRV